VLLAKGALDLEAHGTCEYRLQLEHVFLGSLLTKPYVHVTCAFLNTEALQAASMYITYPSVDLYDMHNSCSQITLAALCRTTARAEHTHTHTLQLFYIRILFGGWGEYIVTPAWEIVSYFSFMCESRAACAEMIEIAIFFFCCGLVS